MHFTQENIKYCLLSFASWESPHSNSYTSQELPLSGLFNWSLAFNGKRAFPRTKEETEEFNIIHVNITANNLNLIPSLIGIVDRTKTKLIFNVDYALEMWYPHFKFPPIFCEQLDKADFIFSVEEEMSYALSRMLKRNIACIPHPTAISEIKKLQTTSRVPVIGAMVHSYDANILLPALSINIAIENLRSTWKSSIIGGVASDKEVGHLYDYFIPHQPDFQKFISYLSNLYAIVESYTFRSYGRCTIEAAALGIPVIGSSIVSSQRRCFPELCTETSQVSKTADLIDKLINDKDFWTETVRTAMQKSDYYSFENTSKMMLDFLNSPQ